MKSTYQEMSKEKTGDLVNNNIWLPHYYQIRERLFKTSGLASIRRSLEIEYSEFITDKKRLEKIKDYFEGEERINALALMFVMDKYHDKQWDFEKGDWAKIR